ncbi:MULTISPECIES: nuclear transport factor 2 family protein [Streptomyces]|nr:MULTISPECIES: nuclear transport factor 2 family protein [unclassified Streptomyces]AAA19619.1 ORFX [Streptomyces roseofulvus]AAC18110.1 actVI-ORFA homolog [Streptomyces roseofulvus]MDT0422239.1 nuclear transport factor 2 family protein [Streptomyces sp. DSM 41859]WEH30875.1 nuclear transport factor 2 family protein [Streptomyces sp. AM 3-1-1]
MTTTTPPDDVRAGSLPGDAARSAALYTEVQAFYARQAHHLDAVRAEEFAATFAAEGVFAHSPDTPAARGRAAIAEEVRGFNARRFADDPVQRRHWFSMLDVRPGEDGAVETEFYALVVVTRPDAALPVIGPSCVVRDVLVREGGELRTLSRQVTQDRTLL